MKLFLKIKYDGTNYAGYQVQNNAPTIQAELNSALYDLFGCECDEVECPLWNACKVGDVALVKYLLEKGVNPIINTATDDWWGEFLIDRMDRWADEAHPDNRKKYRKIYYLLREHCDDGDN